MPGKGKRWAEVPKGVHAIGAMVSKADLLEVAFTLASLDAPEGCDDAEAGCRSLLEALNHERDRRGAKPLKLVFCPGCTREVKDQGHSHCPACRA